MGEHTLFRSDTETTVEGKNGMLGALLLGAWNTMIILKIERVIGSGEQGWQVTYRD